MTLEKENKIVPGGFAPMAVGINGMGRVGKFLAWHFIAKQFFSGIVINLGRESGKSLKDVIMNYFIKDSTFTSLEQYLHGHKGGCSVEKINEQKGTFCVNGILIRILREARRPEQIDWAKHGVALVVDTTGEFLDPSEPIDGKKGSILGHFQSGAKKIIVSAPFKVKKDKKSPMLEKTTTIIAGINDEQYDSEKHSIISTASCTTTCLAHLLNPLWKAYREDIATAFMYTIHAATSTQAVLDRAPKAGADDLRKLRSILNNIIPTSTGAAKALPLVIKGVERIGFGANSIRVPVSTGSIVLLSLSLTSLTDVKSVNEVLRESAEKDKKGYLVFDENQNVSSDIIGTTAACIVEAKETIVINNLQKKISNINVCGWYDNEIGYMGMMTEVIRKVAEEFVLL